MVVVAACGRVGFDESDSIDGAPAVDDSDSDGVLDAVDNCSALANPDQDDEDGDRLGDACDPCPPFPSNDDPDGDGVGGECDPFPLVGGERIAKFAGFQRMPPDIVLDGTWTVSGGKLHVTGALNSLSGATWPVAGNRETVATNATIDAMFGTGVARPVGVVHEFEFATREGTTCVFGINPSDLQVYALADNASTGALVLRATTVNVGDSSRFSSRRNGNAYSCNAERLTGGPMTANNVLSSTPNLVGLHARSASATFDWVLIVTSL